MSRAHPTSNIQHPVSLVGAGPGDPALITVGGAARLAEADVVIYDRLANPALLQHVRPDAERIFAGKSPEHHAMSQDEINALLVAKAREGKRVVRLKGGDPFVFGRGGEEAEALAAAGIPFEIIPGVTSAIAAPAYAGIPVTHRGIASSFAVITGHAADDSSSTQRALPESQRGLSARASTDTTDTIDWPHLATAADTLVFLMGVAALDEIASQLMKHGRSPDTPAAVVEWGTLPRQRTISGTLATIASDVKAAGLQAPSVTVVGEVARMRERIQWFDNRPLSGLRVLVTRTREQASELSRLLAAQGADPIELPTIEIVETADPAEIDAAIQALRTSAYNWVIFTSPNAISIFTRLLRERGLDARAFGRAQLAAIGPGSAAALERAGIIPDVVPAEYVAEGLLDALEGRVLHGARVLLPRAEGARDTLIAGIEAKGARVDELKLYHAAVPHDPDIEGLRRLHSGEIDVVTFASSSAVRNLVEMLGGDLEPLRTVRIAVIGPVTAEAVRTAGLDVAIEASEYTIPGLVAAVVAQARTAPPVPIV